MQGSQIEISGGMYILDLQLSFIAYTILGTLDLTLTTKTQVKKSLHF